ncbi:MAG: (Fe-S)-binding protein [Dehalococcoidia bacterium]|nr:(Fe-S)-binding protein [Dehalococcoidia bacterium]
MSQRKPILNLKKDAVGGYLFAGKTHQEHVDMILDQGVHGTPSTIRKFTLHSLGLDNPGEKAENVVMFGCYPIYGEYRGIESYVKLLDRLDVDFTHLEKEYCCGAFLCHMFTASGEKEKADAEARNFIGMNLAAARECGAKKMAYGCASCAYMAKQYFPDESIEQVYRFDILLDRLRQQNLEMKPTTVGYFPGCHVRFNDLAPGVKLNWSSHREVAGLIKGLNIVDLPRALCCIRGPELIVEAVVKRGLHTIVSPVNCCVLRLEGILKEAKVKVIYLEELFLQALDEAEVSIS